jgi:hypothetical protein
MPENQPGIPPQARIARYDSMRSDKRWEGFKGFIKGALPALAIGAVAGAAVAGAAFGASAIAAAAGVEALAGLGGMGTFALITGSVAAVSGMVSGIKVARQEMREADLNNFAIDEAIKTVERDAMMGVPLPQMPEKSKGMGSRLFDRVLNTTENGLPDQKMEELARDELSRSESTPDFIKQILNEGPSKQGSFAAREDERAAAHLDAGHTIH